MMEEQDLRRIPETAYLNAENAARYRAILHFCYRRHEHMQTFVYPEKIFRELAQTSFFAAYTEAGLLQALILADDAADAQLTAEDRGKLMDFFKDRVDKAHDRRRGRQERRCLVARRVRYARLPQMVRIPELL